MFFLSLLEPINENQLNFIKRWVYGTPVISGIK